MLCAGIESKGSSLNIDNAFIFCFLDVWVFDIFGLRNVFVHERVRGFVEHGFSRLRRR